MGAVKQHRYGFSVHGYGATGDGSADDTAEIQSALTAANTAGGGIVYGTPGKTYKISSALTIYSHTTLDMRGCTVQLAASSNCRMLQTPGVSSSTRVEAVEVIGGRWDRGANSGTGNGLHGLVFRKVDGLDVGGLEYTSTGGKFGILLVDVTDFLVHDIRLDSCYSDGVHIHGPASDGEIRRVHGTAGDDVVAITPLDYAAYVWGDEGNVTDIVIDGVYVGDTTRALVKVLGGAGLETKRITVRNVKGTSNAQGVWVGDDASTENTTGGLVDDIVIENVHVATGTGYAEIQLNPSNGGRIAVRNATWDCQGRTSQACVYVGPEDAVNIESLLVDGLQIVEGSATGAVNVHKGTVERLVVHGVTGNPPASAAIVRLTDGNTAECGSLVISDVVVTPATSTGSVVRAISSTHTLPRVSISNVHADGFAWIADLGITTRVNLSNVYNSGGQFNIRSGATVTVDATGRGSTGGVTNAGALYSKSLGFNVDVSTLVNTANDMAYNTNAGLGCGVGPVIANGSTWKHIYTGSTA